MKVIGKGSVHIYEGKDEYPHAPDNEALWQESFVLFLWDVERQVYVFLRMGQEPNREKGYTTIWLNAWVPGYMYKHMDDSVPFAPGDRGETSLTSGGGLCHYEYDKGRYLWTVNDGGEMIRLMKRGADNIITDDPDLLIRVRDEWAGLSGPERLVLASRLLLGLDP